MMKAWTKFRSALRAFGAARGGNVAITFAFATIPVIGAIGAGFDYSHANSVKADLQAALDSTALMLAKNAATTSSTDLQTEAMSYFKALYNRPETTIDSISASYTASGGSQVLVNGSVDVPTTFLRILGSSAMQNITVSGSSTTKWGTTRLRVALVLDNTGSMADSGKMTALKSATQSLLTQLQNAASTNGDVYVSIIPFVKDVNLGSSNWNSNYIYWDDAAQSDNNSWDANNGSCSSGWSNNRAQCVANSSCSISGYNNKSSCTAAASCSNPGETTQATCTATKACSDPKFTTKTSCKNNSGTWGYGTWTAGVWSGPYWTAKNHNTWTGCVEDRGNSSGPDTVNNYDTNAAAPSTTVTSSLYPAEQYGSCPQSVLGLSYDWSSMSSLVNGMSPNGSTNQNIGLQLGWLSLTGGGPFTAPAMDSGYQYQQVIILLTDGLNTQDRWYGDGGSLGTSDDAKIDAREQLTCSNFKAASAGNVTNTLYTIQVNTDGSPTSTLLQNCASDSTKFFLLTSASGIADVFNTIGTNLTQLRVAK